MANGTAAEFFSGTEHGRTDRQPTLIYRADMYFAILTYLTGHNSRTSIHFAQPRPETDTPSAAPRRPTTPFNMAEYQRKAKPQLIF